MIRTQSRSSSTSSRSRRRDAPSVAAPGMLRPFSIGAGKDSFGFGFQVVARPPEAMRYPADMLVSKGNNDMLLSDTNIQCSQQG
jgi:hypothetical protein